MPPPRPDDELPFSDDDSTRSHSPDAHGADLPTELAAPFPPDLIPGYRLLRRLGAGGQGEVYLAKQERPGREVAIKLVRAYGGSASLDAQRLEREIDALVKIKTPGVVAVHHTGVVGDVHYIVMEYVKGEALSRYLDRLRADPPSGRAEATVRAIVELMARVTRIVDAAHRAGIVHRDLKPSNVLVNAAGEPHVLDFGLAKAALGSPFADGTAPGIFIGSAPWTSPEQAAGDNLRLDTRADVYALGVMLYHAVSGQFPYDVTGSTRDVLDRVVSNPPAPLSKSIRGIDRDLETIVLKALAKTRDRRYTTAGELADDLERWLAGAAILARRENLVYRARVVLRRWARRNPAAALATGLGAAFVVHVGVYYFLAWSGLSLLLAQALVRWVPASAAVPSFEHVAIVALRSDESVRRMAESQNLPTVSADHGNIRSLRPLHGRLLKHLAESGARCVAVDYVFETASEDDAELRAGIEALTAASPPIPVVLATRTWAGEEGAPRLSPALITRGVRWGPISFDPTTWAVDLALHRKRDYAEPSFALSTYAAYRHPAADEVQYSFVSWERAYALQVSYRSSDPNAPGVRRLAGASDLVRYSVLEKWTPQDATVRGPEDRLALMLVDIAHRNILDLAIADYESILNATPAQLRERLAGKAVLVAEARGELDVHDHPRHGPLLGVCAHAAALEQLIRGSNPQLSGSEGALLMAVSFGLAMLIGAFSSPQLWARVLAGLILLSLILFLAVVSFRMQGYIFDPFSIGIGSWVAFEGGAWVARCRAVLV